MNNINLGDGKTIILMYLNEFYKDNEMIKIEQTQKLNM